MLVLSGNRVACESQNQIQVWNLNDGTCIQTLEGHTDKIECIIVLADETIVSGSADKTIQMWNLSENRYINTLHGHSDTIFCLLLLKDGRLFWRQKYQNLEPDKQRMFSNPTRTY